MTGLPEPAFPVVLRGYSREAVDAYVAALRRELVRVREARALTPEEEDRVARRRILEEGGVPGQAGAGSRIEQLLRLAEEQASQMVAAARAEAARIRAEAHRGEGPPGDSAPGRHD